MGNNSKKKRKSSVSLMFRKAFLGSGGDDAGAMIEERMQSPFHTIMRNFRENKLAMTGVIVFLFIFLCVFFLPLFFPLDVTYQDVTQQNIAPGFSMLAVPKELARNAEQISAGGTFGAGIDKNGKLYTWGKMDDRLKDTPRNMGKLVQVSAGLNHILALNDEGQLFTWGYNRLRLDKIPLDLDGVTDIKQILAGYQISIVVTEDGHLYYWGNDNIISIRPSDYQGQIDKAAVSTTTVVILTKDKRVAALSNKDTPFSRIPDEVQGKAVDVATTDKAAAALTADGKVYTWGLSDDGALEVPQEIQGKVKQISAGRSHFSALTSDGKVYCWGLNDDGQCKVPAGLSNVEKISSGYFQNYAIDSDGGVHTWGLKGYLMGTDGFGRDVFRRLLTGGRMTMTIGAIAVIISSLIGVMIGGISGYYGGKVDNILMRFAEIVSSIPFLPLAMILSAVLGSKISETQRIALIMVILGVLNWPGLSRLVRAQVLSEREKEFVTAAKAMGIREAAIIFRYILPNVITVIIVNMTLDFATCMLIESSLSFLGFGVIEPNPTWGNMLTGSQSSTVIGRYWWRWVFPSVALSLATISINTIGDGFRDAIDPKSNERQG